MGTKEVIDLHLEPDWPEWGFYGDGTRIRLADAARLPSKLLPTVWFEKQNVFGSTIKVWPWKNASVLVDDATGELLAPIGKPDLPRMSRENLVATGMSDAELARDFARYFGKKPDPALDGPDGLDVQAERKRVFDMVMRRLYG